MISVWRYSADAEPVVTPLLVHPGEVVLDPFIGSGTVAEIAIQHGRSCLGIELNPAYVSIARQRIMEAARLDRRIEENVNWRMLDYVNQ